jgi:hypothetical protein
MTRQYNIHSFDSFAHYQWGPLVHRFHFSDQRADLLRDLNPCLASCRELLIKLFVKSRAAALLSHMLGCPPLLKLAIN